MRSTLALLLLLVVAAPAGAQGLLPFQKDERARRYDVYMARVAEGVARSLADWNQAWNADDATALARTYREDATLYVDDDVLYGRDAIQRHFDGLLPRSRSLSVFPEDLQASGDMAYRVVVIRYQEDRAPEAAHRVERRDLFVYRKRGDNDWEVQAHFTGPETGTEREA